MNFRYRNDQSWTLIHAGVLYTIIFLSSLIFYTCLSPLVIYDMDDWLYIFYTRNPWPQWGGWNPIRILPELLMPFTARLSTWLIYPVTGKFMYSIELGMTIVMSLVLTVYARSFFRLMRKIISTRRAILLTGMFLVMHLLNECRGK